MNCEEFTRRLMTEDWSELSEGDAQIHVVRCTRCAALRQNLEQAYSMLQYTLSAARPSIPAALLADRARLGARLRTIERGLLVIPLLVLVLLVWLGFRGLPASTVELLTGRRPPPAMKTETVLLRCLSVEQARALAAPYLSDEGRAVVGGDGTIPTLALRGTSEEVTRATEVIEQFEDHANAACRQR